MNYINEIAKLIKIQGVEPCDIESSLTTAADSSFGDYSLPCFKFSKALRQAPNAIAARIADGIESAKPDFLESVEAVGGYVNFSLDKKLFSTLTLGEIFQRAGEYGNSDEGAGKTVCIDFSSINIAKPFHIGHLGTTVIGAALYRIFKKLGYNAVGINHLGDFGTQFGKLIVAYKLWGDADDIKKRGLKALVDIYVRFHKEEEQDAGLTARAREWFLKIERGQEEAVALFNFFKEVTMKEVEQTYRRLGVTFDSYAGESFYNDKMQPVIDELKQKDLLKLSDGASIVDLSRFDMPPCLILRSDGASLYATRDLATIFYRKKTYDFDKCLYVVAYQQNLHFKQVFKVIELLGYEYHKDLIHVAYGMVSLEDGAMATRKGNMVYLSDVLDRAAQKSLAIIREKSPDLKDAEAVAEAVGVSAVIFSALINNRIKDNVFTYEKILNFDGETGPYLQYTCARCHSIIEKALGAFAADGSQAALYPSLAEALKSADADALTAPDAYEVIKLLGKYPDVIRAAKENYEPSLVTRHLIDIAQSYNKFYFDNRILDERSGVKNARVAITAAVKEVLKNGFEVLGLRVVERM
ncbi:MAG: arginine--tRNA ligase [Clostridiales bacterium]|jgi:arginyl-tRNA synthetase|nr:arginine--tRNA ligase [Clostridiales bacterium]